MIVPPPNTSVLSRMWNLPRDIKVIVGCLCLWSGLVGFLIAPHSHNQSSIQRKRPAEERDDCHHLQYQGSTVNIKVGGRVVGTYPSMHEALHYLHKYELKFCTY